MTGAATDLIQNITSSTKNRDEIKSTTTIRIGYQFNIFVKCRCSHSTLGRIIYEEQTAILWYRPMYRPYIAKAMFP